MTMVSMHLEYIIKVIQFPDGYLVLYLCLFSFHIPLVNIYIVLIYDCNCINYFNFYLDGLDGKQARRTGTSGPLGELFDHGLDSWTTVFIPTALYSIFGRDDPNTIQPIRMYYICIMVFINFYLAHWEKYNTGVLYLPWSYDLSMVVSFNLNVIILLMYKQYSIKNLIIINNN